MKQVLVSGYGSIGRRHARLLAEAGHGVSVVSRQGVTGHPVFATLDDALAARSAGYDLIILAGATAGHGADLAALARLGSRAPVLVEKPLLDRLPLGGLARPPFPVHVAYNLRFHPVIAALRAALAGRRPRMASLVAGQHLGQWRPGRVVAETYSAHRDQGGGVVRDLSHELDLVQHLFGEFELLAAKSARVGDITVDSEDAAAAVLSARACPFVTVQLDYLDLSPRRQIRVVTDSGTLEADVIRGTLTVDGEAKAVPVAPDQSYRAMHAAALDDGAGLCTWEEGLAVVALADRIAPNG